MTAHRAARRKIGIDAVSIVFNCRDVVDSLQQRTRVKQGDDAVAGVSPATLNHLAFARGDAAIASHAELELDFGLWAGAMSEEVLFARQPHQNLAPCGACQKRR